MSNESGQESPSAPKQQRRRIWTTTSLTLGAIATLGIAGGAWWAWMFANERLAPWASDFLTDALDRPVSLGEVERVSLTGVRFGPSAMPATATDPDELFVEGIDVRFNPLDLLRREINPRIRLTGIQAYIEQNAQGDWVDVEFDLDDNEEDDDEETDPFIQVSPTVGFTNSEVVLLPYLGPMATPLPYTISDIDGSVTVEAVEVENPIETGKPKVEAQQISLALTATPDDAGDLNIDGVIRQLNYGEDAPDNLLDAFEANLAIQVQRIDLGALAPIAIASTPGTLPITINGGIISGNVDAELVPFETPRLTGTATVQDGELVVDALETPFTQINTQARFQGNRVALEETTATYGDLMAMARGTIDPRNGYNLTGAIAPVTLAGIANTFNFDYPIDMAATLRARDVKMTGPLAEPVVTGLVETTDAATLDQVDFARVASQVTYRPNGFDFDDFIAEPLAGGTLAGRGAFDFGQPPTVDLKLEGRNLPADAIAQPYGLPETVAIGTLTLDADISGPVNDLIGVVTWDAPDGTYPTRGTAEVAANTLRIPNAAIAGGTLTGIGTLNQGQWTADVQAQGLQLGSFNESLQGVTAGGDVRLAGSTDNFSLAGIRGNGDVTAALRGGTLNSQFDLAGGNWNANVSTRNFPVQQFSPNVPVSSLSADAQLAGNVNDFSPTGIRGDGTATAAIAGGTVTSTFTLANGDWQADGRGDNLQLQQLSDDLRGTGQATFQLAGNLDDLSPTGIQGRANIRLSDGLATARALNPALGRSPTPLDASLAWDGRQLQIDRLETAGLFASGTVTPLLSGPSAPGISAIDLGIRADDYALAALPVSLPPLVGVEGTADFQGRLTGTPSNLNFAGDLALYELALNDLVFDPVLAGDVNYSTAAGLAVGLYGQADEISVNYVPQTRRLDALIRAGDAIAVADTEGDLLRAEVYNFPVSALNIPPANTQYGSLRGRVEYANASINLTNFDTVGQFDVQNLGLGLYSVDRLYGGFSYADGIARLNEGQIVMADRNARGEAIATRTYDLSGRYNFTQTPQLTASLSTDEGELQDVFEILKIQDLADFRRGLTPNDGFIPTSTAEAEAILATTPVGNPNDTLLNQLRRLSEIEELEFLAEVQAEEARVPPLSELQGSFNGQIDLAATLPENIELSFDLKGNNWAWGPDIEADIVVLQGNYTNGLVNLSPVRFSTKEEGELASVSLAGSFSLDPEDMEERQMKLRVINVPIDQIEDFAKLPFDLEGRLNSTTTLSGRLGDPTLAGQLEVVDGILNGTAIDDATATYTYANARGTLDAELLLIGSDDPLTLSAQVPYQFAFVEVEPADQSYIIKANVKDEGLALLNIFTQQIAWESGQGEIILDLEGDLAEDILPTKFQGLVLLEDATISARALPVPMTNVTGQIRLLPASLALVVDDLTGQFSEGELSAQGVFPLLYPLEDLSTEAPEPAAPDLEDVSPEMSEDSATAAANETTGEASTAEDITGAASVTASPALAQTSPLTLSLDNIALNLQGLYNGQVDGRMQLLGSLLFGPKLTGEIDLSQGTITVPEGGNTSTSSVANSATETQQNSIPPFSFDNLRIVLARNINIVQGNFLNVAARGGLRLDGTLDTLQPNGTIQLPSGRVGLFAVALRLAGSNDRAEFRGNFDPILDVTLQTSLPDASSAASDIGVTTSPFPQNEVSDNTIQNIGLTQQGNSLVRINARYTGPASELANLTTDSRNLELSSSPPRSNAEIVTLLSGNVIGALDALESGDALTGIGTFVGSALLNSVREFLGDTVPISEFRIFQVNESSGGVNDSEDIGGEIGFDVTSNISVSVLKVLTNDTPFQFNTRYRLSDQFTVRGTTSYEDFSDRTGVLLEYETRF
ncbi:MAG: translocation/assembly module TamB domain-containing protein [Leptolyngbyaceae cyanobacterium]